MRSWDISWVKTPMDKPFDPVVDDDDYDARAECELCYANPNNTDGHVIVFMAM
jgi:hypothetical protein